MQSNTNVMDRPVEANETDRLISSEKSTALRFITRRVSISVPSII
jgi:hypothetical protein